MKGKGNYVKGREKKIIKSERYKEKDLHQKINIGSSQEQTRFSLSVNKETTNNRLDKAGGGADAYDYGDEKICNKPIFEFENIKK